MKKWLKRQDDTLPSSVEMKLLEKEKQNQVQDGNKEVSTSEDNDYGRNGKHLRVRVSFNM